MAETAPSYSLEDIQQIPDDPEFQASPPDERSAIMDHALSSAYQEVSQDPEFGPEAYQEWGGLAHDVQNRVASMTTTAEHAKALGRGAVNFGKGLYGMARAGVYGVGDAMASDQGTKEHPMAKAAAKAVVDTGLNIGAAFNQFASENQDEGQAVLGTLDKVKQGLDSGEFGKNRDDFEKWIKGHDAALNQQLPAWYSRARSVFSDYNTPEPSPEDKHFASLQGLLMPHNVALIHRYMSTRNPALWKQVVDNVKMTPEVMGTQGLMQDASTTDGGKLYEKMHGVGSAQEFNEAFNPINILAMAAGLFGSGKAASAGLKAAGLLDTTKAIATQALHTAPEMAVYGAAGQIQQNPNSAPGEIATAAAKMAAIGAGTTAAVGGIVAGAKGALSPKAKAAPTFGDGSFPGIPKADTIPADFQPPDEPVDTTPPTDTVPHENVPTEAEQPPIVSTAQSAVTSSEGVENASSGSGREGPVDVPKAAETAPELIPSGGAGDSRTGEPPISPPADGGGTGGTEGNPVHVPESTPPQPEPVAPQVGTPKQRRMIERVLATQGIAAHLLPELAERLSVDLPEDLTAEQLREHILKKFEAAGGILPDSIPKRYVEMASMYEAQGHSPEEAAQMAADSVAANRAEREGANATNRGLAKSPLEQWADDKLKQLRREGRTYTGLDPELWAAWTVKGAYHFTRGAKNFALWSKIMLKQFGKLIEPHLKDLWDASRKVATDKSTAGHFASQQPHATPYDAAVARAKAAENPELIKPIQNGLNQAARSAKDMRSAIAPESVGGKATATAAGILRENLAKLEHRKIQGEKALREASRWMAKRSDAENLLFIDRMERGIPQPTPAETVIAKALQDAIADRTHVVQSMGFLQELIENYFPHLWKDPLSAGKWFNSVFGKRPLQGSRSFLKQRSIPTTLDGTNWRAYDADGKMVSVHPDETSALAAMPSGGHIGEPLKPVTYNPVDLALMKIHEMDRFIMGRRVLAELKSAGLLHYVKATEQIPFGYGKINDSIAQVTSGVNASGALELRGQWVAPEDVSKLLNNHLDPSWFNNNMNGLFKGARFMGNAMNQVQLGLSAFHLFTTSMNAVMSKAAQAAEQAVGGNLSKALGSAVRTPIAPFEMAMTGDKLLKEYLNPGSQGGDYMQLLDALHAGGGRVRVDDVYKTGAMGAFYQSFQEKSLGGAVKGTIAAPFAAFEAAGYPLMNYLIPRIKLGAFADLARDELAKLPASATRADVQAKMGEIWNSIDNRFGQMVYDNLFWRRTQKDMLMLAVRSVGWNLGTIRELGGGLMDAGRGVRQLTKGQKPVLTHRLAFTIMLPLIAGTVGAIYQYVHTGKGPEDLQDYMMPRTGKTRPDGTPERVMLPSYMKDVAAYTSAFKHDGPIKGPINVLKHKTGPLPNFLIESYENKDFYNTDIRNPNDPLVQQIGQEAAHLAKQFIPFTMTSSQHRVGGNSAESYIGITPAPAEWSRTEAHNRMMDFIINKTPQGGRTPEAAARSQLRKDLIVKAVAGGSVGSDMAASGFTAAQARGVMKQAATDPQMLLFSHLTPAEAVSVMQVANPQEQAKWGPVLIQKVAKASPYDREQALKYASGPAKEVLKPFFKN